MSLDVYPVAMANLIYERREHDLCRTPLAIGRIGRAAGKLYFRHVIAHGSVQRTLWRQVVKQDKELPPSQTATRPEPIQIVQAVEPLQICFYFLRPPRRDPERL